MNSWNLGGFVIYCNDQGVNYGQKTINFRNKLPQNLPRKNLKGRLLSDNLRTKPKAVKRPVLKEDILARDFIEGCIQKHQKELISFGQNSITFELLNIFDFC